MGREEKHIPLESRDIWLATDHRPLNSNVSALFWVPTKIPAGLESGVGKHGVDARLGRRWVEDELRLAVLLGDCVVVIDLDVTVRAAIEGDADAEDSEIGDPGKGRTGDQGDEDAKEESLKLLLAGEGLAHDGRL